MGKTERKGEKRHSESERGRERDPGSCGSLKSQALAETKGLRTYSRPPMPPPPLPPPPPEGCMPRGGKPIIRPISRRVVFHSLMQQAEVSERLPPPKVSETCPTPAARLIQWGPRTIVVSDSPRRVSDCDIPCSLLYHPISFLVMVVMILGKPMYRMLPPTRDNVWLVDFVCQERGRGRIN
ncbi:hypothetical protein LY76DRAFT_267011 [Colletotrichum caudatum]|nr:hypothetical protein LY76DRAFT_267011 [Colletotrichum caudatum]